MYTSSPEEDAHLTGLRQDVIATIFDILELIITVWRERGWWRRLYEEEVEHEVDFSLLRQLMNEIILSWVSFFWCVA
jgi:hypothetical protein